MTAVIGAISGIVAACLTSIVTTKGIEKAALRAEQRNARYLAVQVGTSLKKYANACYGVAHDDGYDEGLRAGGDECKPTAYVHAF